jgi:2',3'-cyclic-nucleotide 2'-phosphodiesterase (5'-nucleotidase family)
VPDVLVLDVGDSLIRDRSPATTSRGASSVELLNMMSYDAMVLGGGDLELLGVDRLGELLPEAQFATLSADLVFPDRAMLDGTDVGLVQPYLIRQIQGHAVALIGLTGALRPGNEVGQDTLEFVRQAIKGAGQEANVLILLSHAGIWANEQIAAQFPELDLIVSGGGTGYTPQPFLTDGSPPIVQADMASPGHTGRRIGVGTWWFDDQGRLVGYDWETVPLTPEIADDIEMSRWVRDNP